MNLPNANPALPSPFAVFTTDARLDKVERIARVEQMLLATYGTLHVPQRTSDGEVVIQYFARDVDAQIQRRWRARYIVESEILEERRAETLAAIDARQGMILQSIRETADRQKAEYLRDGYVSATGYELLDAMLAEDARRAEAKITRGVA